MASATGGGGQASSSSGVDADHLESWVRSIAPDADRLHRSRLWVLPDGSVEMRTAAGQRIDLSGSGPITWANVERRGKLVEPPVDYGLYKSLAYAIEPLDCDWRLR